MFIPPLLKRLSCGAAFLFAVAHLDAAVKLPTIFSDHMVLQADKPVNIWGKADAGEKVVIEFLGKTYNTQADAEGKWKTALDASPKGGPTTLKVNDRVINDVLVGEVWLASGQSNMQFTVMNALNAKDEMAAATNKEIREYSVPKDSADLPKDDVPGARWVVSDPKAVGTFSAVAYFFARDINKSLQTPVGIIHSSWGGSPVEGWMSPESLSDPAFATVRQRWADLLKIYPAKQKKYDEDMVAWKEAVKQDPKAKRPPPAIGPASQHKLSGPYNGMIKPLIPYTFRGMLWYQGEANVPRGETYSALFKTFIPQMRQDFGQGDFPFYFVMLANLGPYNSTNFAMPFLRESQAAALSLPQTGMAVATDVGEDKNIHPINKQEVGKRLALIALANAYGKGGEFSGPILQESTVDGGGMKLAFTHADGMTLKPARPDKKSFELAGADKVFHPATATVEGDTIIVTSPQVTAPVALRYAFAANPDLIVYNAAGLPAPPFRTDTWPVLPLPSATAPAETGE